MTADEIAAQAELDIFDLLGQFLAGKKVGSPGWKIEKMAQLGAVSRAASKRIGKYKEMLAGAGGQEVEDAIKARIDQVDDTLEKAGFGPLPAPANTAIGEATEALSKSVALELAKMGDTMTSQVPEIYQDIIGKSANEVALGIKAPQEALEDAMIGWADQGVPVFVDDAGRRWNADAYARMQIRTVQRSGMTELTMQRSRQYGNDLVEVDSHAGARPGCEPYQGKVYSLSGKAPNFPPLSSTTKGDPDGLFGINCRHNMYPYFAGSRKTYEPMDERKNDRIYKQSQKQRGYERKIRESKRRVKALENAGLDAKKQRELLIARESRLKAFLQETDRRRRGDLEKVFN